MAIQKEFRLGYAPDDRSALRNHLAEKKVAPEQMVEAGLIIQGEGASYDRFRDRVMFPIRDPRGRVIAFGGRALSKDVPAKYLNSPETPLFHKGHVLYNLDKARGPAHEQGAIIAVEGYIDVIAMHRAGLPNAVAPLGTALTEDQLAILWRTAPEPTLCFDGDSAGIKAAYRALDLALPLLKPGHSLKFALLPEGQDPDDLLKSQGAQAVKDVISAAQPLSEVLWQRALTENDRATPERKAQFERDLRLLINQIGDDVVKKHYLADMSAKLQSLWGQTGGKANRRERTVPVFPVAEAVQAGTETMGYCCPAFAPASRPGRGRANGPRHGTAGADDPALSHQSPGPHPRRSGRNFPPRIAATRA